MLIFLKLLCNGLKGCWQVLWGAAYARAQGLPVTAFLALSAPFSGEANKLQSREGNECKSGLTSPDLLLPDFATISFECFDFLLEICYHLLLDCFGVRAERMSRP